MTWNYRVMRHRHEHVEEGEPPYWYGIHEVYYDEGYKLSWGTDPEEPFAETPEEMGVIIKLMAAAPELPVLDYETGMEINGQEPQEAKEDEEKGGQA